MPADPDDVVALIIASALTLMIFNVAGAVGVWAIWRARKKTEARDPGAGAKSDALAPLYYILSLLFWPASLVLCVLFIGKPPTSRMGAICGTLGIAQVMAIAWGTCTVVALFASDIVPWLP